MSNGEMSIFTRANDNIPLFVEHNGVWREVISITNLVGVAYSGCEMIPGFHLELGPGEYIMLRPEQNSLKTRNSDKTSGSLIPPRAASAVFFIMFSCSKRACRLG